MRLTIGQAAQAVGKSEGYVRQHINRGHLRSELIEGARIVESAELLRWAKERGLPVHRHMFDVGLLSAANAPRVARVAVLTQVDGTRRINLLTTIRHRRADSLGPWARPLRGWRLETQAAGVELYLAEFADDAWRSVLGEMRAGRLAVLDQTIEYELDPAPTVHYGWRDRTIGSDANFNSPFRAHSAEITEFWAAEETPRKRWLEVREQFPEASLRRLGLPLDRFIDRVGNVVIFAAFDELTCSIGAGDQGIRFTARANGLFTAVYHAEIWAAQGEDVVLRREFLVSAGDTHFELEADIDRVGFALYRDGDGQCIDLSDTHFLRGVGFGMTLLGPELVLQSRKKKVLGRTHMATITDSTVEADARNALFGRIRQRRHERITDVHETAARRQQLLFRFQPGQFDAAIEQFAKFIEETSRAGTPTYLADRYFLNELEGDADAKLRGYLRLLRAAQGRSLRILCTRVNPAPPDWWVQLPSVFRDHVEIRAILQRVPGKSELQPGFHDRFLITSREVLFTNSINGWIAHGVTFASCPFGVYRADAERMWNIPLGENAGDCVRKLSP